jgi:UDP-glucose 4-epimerase
MKVFLTGGTGFIGSYVTMELLKHGHTVKIFARNPDKVRAFKGNPSIQIVQGWLTDRDVIKFALEGMDAVVHIALGWGDMAVAMLQADTLPSVFIFETAAQLGVKKILYTSSVAAIGDHREILNEDTNLRPNNFYGATKAAAEAYLLGMRGMYDVTCNVIRPGYTFGNPIVEGSFIQTDKMFPMIVQKAKANEPITLTKDSGTQFIWAGDLAKIYSAVLHSPFDRRVFTGMGTEFVTWERIARHAVDSLGSKSRIVLEEKPGAGPRDVFDVSAIEKSFGLRFTCFDRIKEHLAYLSSRD